MLPWQDRVELRVAGLIAATCVVMVLLGAGWAHGRWRDAAVEQQAVAVQRVLSMVPNATSLEALNGASEAVAGVATGASWAGTPPPVEVLRWLDGGPPPARTAWRLRTLGSTRVGALPAPVVVPSGPGFGAWQAELLAAALLWLGLVWAELHRLTAAPLRRVADTLSRASGGAETGSLDLTQLGDDAAVLVDRLAEVEEVHGVYERYVSRGVRAELRAGRAVEALGGEERVVTLLYADIASFTRLAEVVQPAEALSLLNEFLGAATELVEAHGGSVLDFSGDALLGIFGAPDRCPDHADRAVRAAQEMDQRVQELNRVRQAAGDALWQRAGLEGLNLRIGLHTGRVVVGNIGSAHHMKYDAIGDAVNVSARVEQLNKLFGTRVLVTAEVIGALVQAPPELRDQGWVNVRGRDRGLHVYALGEPAWQGAQAGQGTPAAGTRRSGGEVDHGADPV